MITMPSDSVKEVLGQLIGNFSHAIGNYDLLREAEVYLTMIPAMLAERGVGEYTDTIRELESRYDRAVASIDDPRGGVEGGTNGTPIYPERDVNNRPKRGSHSA